MTDKNRSDKFTWTPDQVTITRDGKQIHPAKDEPKTEKPDHSDKFNWSPDDLEVVKPAKKSK